ncbi:MAG: 50S ribosomal protein L24 [Clostridiales bacterium]|nr:50S ribosomal protein L24 [Clostridiales bacterium]MBQ3019566.1 50S ribosomal protein L24 [Clostridia bacterium]
MNVKVNDNVLVIAGKDKGVQGKVLATSPKANTVTVEGVRILKKHQKARKANETSKIEEMPGPIDVSNVMVVCPACGKATRVYHNVVDGKKVRVCKCGAVLDKAYSKKAAKAAAAVAEEAPKKRTRKRAAKTEAPVESVENTENN